MTRSAITAAEARETETEGALAGVRVIELGMLLAGPFAGRLLGDMGAEIIKVEPVGCVNSSVVPICPVCSEIALTHPTPGDAGCVECEHGQRVQAHA